MKSIPVCLLLHTLLFGCATGNLCHADQTEPLPMEPLFQLNPTSAQDLSSQSRVFDTGDRAAVLQAGAAALQDMGFKITGGEKQFGLLLGEKTTEVSGAGMVHAVSEAALVTATVVLSLLIGHDVVTDLPEQVAQTIHVSLLVSEPAAKQPNTIEVRISLDRDMHYDYGGIIPDHTELPLVYQEFFNKLSKSIYLEGERL